MPDYFIKQAPAKASVATLNPIRSNFLSIQAARLPLILALVLPLLAAGCHRDEIKVYRVAKDQDQPQQQTAPALPTDSPNPALPPGHPDISSAPAAVAPAAAGSALPQL